MPRHWFLILLPFILFPSTFAQCSSDTCPPGGIWGEWTTTGSCKTTCGACDSLTYTRTCLSDAMKCKCDGDAKVTKLCGTQACNYPRTNGTAKPCCTGTPMVINNWYHCGPLQSTNSLACCPTGGYWSAWGNWSQVTGKVQWSRSRTCLSGGLNCPCVGSAFESKYTCPCIPMRPFTTADADKCTAKYPTPSRTLFHVRDPYVQAARCVNTFIMEASNYRQEFYTDGPSPPTTIRWIDSKGECHTAEARGIGKRNSTDGTLYKFDFPCRLNTMRFGGNMNGTDMEDLDAIGQFSF